MAGDESELVKALKQMIELRSNNNNHKSVTLFGKKISPAAVDQAVEQINRKDDCVMQSIEKLAASKASGHLKDLYKQHLNKRRGRTSSLTDASDGLTLPLLGTMQDHNGCDHAKRRKTGDDDGQYKTSPMIPISPLSIKAAQLTVFYKGQMYVYDDVPLDKAKAMMILAGNSSSKSSHFLANSSTPPVTDLPQARKASLQRFLEKRKERLLKDELIFVKKESEVGSEVESERVPCFSRNSSPRNILVRSS